MFCKNYIFFFKQRFCAYAKRAKSLLEKKNITFIEHKIDGDNDARALMIERANGKRTVPQIFINDKSIGGCDELYELEKDDKLDLLLD